MVYSSVIHVKGCQWELDDFIYRIRVPLLGFEPSRPLSMSSSSSYVPTGDPGRSAAYVPTGDPGRSAAYDAGNRTITFRYDTDLCTNLITAELPTRAIPTEDTTTNGVVSFVAIHELRRKWWTTTLELCRIACDGTGPEVVEAVKALDALLEECVEDEADRIQQHTRVLPMDITRRIARTVIGKGATLRTPLTYAMLLSVREGHSDNRETLEAILAVGVLTKADVMAMFAAGYGPFVSDLKNKQCAADWRQFLVENHPIYVNKRLMDRFAITDGDIRDVAVPSMPSYLPHLPIQLGGSP